jgi:methylamine utilization protein MauE
MLSESSMIETGQVLTAQLALFQALLLIVSALHKASSWSRSLGVMRQFGGVPGALSGAALVTVMASEIVAALLLLVPAYRAAGAILAAALWAVYLGLILRAILQNRRDQDCGCSFGLASRTSSRPLGAFQVTRNAVLALMALGIAGMSGAAGAVSAELSQLLGGVALLALYGALDQVMALQPLRSGDVL